jgi:oxygen-independent coproporphyrinogen-3 oxidase
MSNHSRPVRHLYAHIPFCPVKCPYCAFVTHVGGGKLIEPYVDALRAEISALPAAAGGRLSTVYLGGGTPSMLGPRQVARILDEIDRRFGIQPRAEISMEAHPDTVSPSSLRGYCQAGVTRLSFGGESMNPDELRQIGRSHGPDRVVGALLGAREAGIASVNVDLMYGLPGQTRASWKHGLRMLVSEAPDHISLYPLSVEPGTVFARRARRKDLTLPSDGRVADMYHDACDILRQAGYLHYEVANWARTGHESRHNLAYWHNREYYAVGVGAHGYVHPYRWENIRHTSRYIERVRAGEPVVAGREHIDADTELCETVMLRLRLLREGLDLREIARNYGDTARGAVEDASRDLTERGFLERRGDVLLLAERLVPIANDVWQRFVGLRVAELVAG